MVFDLSNVNVVFKLYRCVQSLDNGGLVDSVCIYNINRCIRCGQCECVSGSGSRMVNIKSSITFVLFIAVELLVVTS